MNNSNILGQELFCNQYKTLSISQVQIDVTNMPPGVYFIKINGITVRKFVKE